MKSKKILLISDTHIPTRNKMDLYSFLKNKKYDFLVHCGDFTNYETFQICKLLAKDRFFAVYGNCDSEKIKTEIPAELNLKINNRRILILHSFQIYPRWDKKQLLEYAIRNKAEIVFYGHTHTQIIFYYDKLKNQFFIENKINFRKNRIYFINPGSLVDRNWLFVNL